MVFPADIPAGGYDCGHCGDGIGCDKSGGFDIGGQRAAALEDHLDLLRAFYGFQLVGGIGGNCSETLTGANLSAQRPQ